MDAERAAESLDCWRAQTPFQKEELLLQRLAMDGLSLEDFTVLLGESGEGLRDRAAAPLPWLAELEEAFGAGPGSSERLAPEQARKLDLLIVMQPLMARSRERLRAAAKRIVAGQPDALFEPDSAVEAFFDVLVNNLAKALRRTLVLELHIAARTGQVQGTPGEQMAQFLERLQQPEYALGILRQYPVAARHVVECAGRWFAFASEVLAQLAADSDIIRKTFHSGEDPGPLVEAQGGVSDPHRGERTVLLLRFRSGLRLVYKPKPLALDAAFQNLLVWLNERGADLAFRPLLVLDRGDYGWVEFITHLKCTAADEVHRFYLRQGGYLALFHALAATDFHHENLLACGEHPIPIDLETLFHSSPAPADGQPREILADEAVWNSVLRPGLLPQRIWAQDNEGVDISGFCAVEGQVTSMPVLRMESGDDGLVRFARKVVDLPVGPEHLPAIEGQEVAARDHIEAIAAGFESVYRLLVLHRDGLMAPEGPLAACADTPSRFIARPTAVYERLLFESYHPYVLQDALDRDRLLDRLWVDVESRPGLKGTFPSEHRALAQGDIPLFTSLVGSRDLWTSSGERIPGVLAESGLERVHKVLLGMGEADLRAQLRIVNGTLKTLRMHAQEQVWPSYDFRDAESPAPADRFLTAARAVADRLESVAFRQNGSVTWLGYNRMGATSYWSYEPVGYALYSGISGIALFLGHLGAVTEESRYVDLAKAALATVRGRLAADSGDWTGLGAYTGAASVIYTLLQLGTAWREPDLFAEAEALVETLPGKIEIDDHLDLLSGSAGCLLVLLQLHAIRPSRQTLAAAVLCGDRLLSQAKEMETGLGWIVPGAGDKPLTGLSHGTAGIAWALAELASVTGEERFRKAFRGALDYERSLFSAEWGNWPDLREDAIQERPDAASGFMCAWCHGAPGIGLARLACLPLLSGPELRQEVEVAVETTLRQGFGGNHSLCHGDLGNLDFVLEASRRLGREDLAARVPLIAAGILQGVEKHGWISGLIAAPEIPGLMLGIAGIGYQLLRLAAVEQVPSILLLEKPRGTSFRSGAIGVEAPILTATAG
ncbi:MAG TPA: type 2 lanthipeptide synthetase LanM family protein [Thermoanaerobaculia bacterium]|nr:type 2 lanthipeptide synthetase LanM family protein [Thermoanaerobaculia bacterium]